VPRSERALLAAGGGAAILAIAAVSMLFVPVDTATEAAETQSVLLFESPPATPTQPVSSGPIVVDVEGAVVAPGVRTLPAGSRVADAVAAAGGYAADADLAAAATAINLAQPLSDGEQIVVPRIGDAPATAPQSSAGGAGSAGGLVDLNAASAEELEALPGIGEVTADKIIAARQERPFASLQDAVDRGVINNGQLEDIQGLATAG